MIYDFGCFDCLLTRIRFECELVGADVATVDTITEECADLLRKHMNDQNPAPVIASRIHRHACERLGEPDPFREIKDQNNTEALALCEEVGPSLTTFRDLCLASVIANTLDHGSSVHTVTDDLPAFFRTEFAEGFLVDDTDTILPLTKRVVFLCDNCGEVVFDRLLMQYLKEQGSHLTVVVKTRPVINDATTSDAELLGLGDIADLVTTNTTDLAEIGLDPAKAPDALLGALEKCTVVIAKGMGNFESLWGQPGLPPIAHLMTVKCEPVANMVGYPKGSQIALLKSADDRM